MQTTTYSLLNMFLSTKNVFFVLNRLIFTELFHKQKGGRFKNTEYFLHRILCIFEKNHTKFAVKKSIAGSKSRPNLAPQKNVSHLKQTPRTLQIFCGEYPRYQSCGVS